MFILLVMFTVRISYAEMEDEWVSVKKYSVTDFDDEGKNLYIDGRGYFYVDKIDMTKKELIIEKFNEKKELIDTIRTGFIYEKTEENIYRSRNEKLAFYFVNGYLYLFYPGRRVTGPFDELWKVNLESMSLKKEKTLSLRGHVKYSIFGLMKQYFFYEEEPVEDTDVSFQMKMIVREKNILLYGYFRSGGEEATDFEDYALFDSNGQVQFTGKLDGYDRDHKDFPIYITDTDEIIRGMLAPEMMESVANDIGYTISEGWTHIYRGFHRTDLYVDSSGKAWISRDMKKAGGYWSENTSYESGIFGLENKNGEWKVTEFIHPFNFHELRYNVFIDRIIKAEGNKLWLWVRIGHNITGPYEDRYFDREIWVIDKK